MNISIKTIVIASLFIFLSSFCQAQSITKLKDDAKNLNDSWSQNKLGSIYENGEGVDKNPELAFYWYKKSPI